MLSTKRIKHGIIACVLVLWCALPALAHMRVEAPPEFSSKNVIAAELERTLRSLTLLSGDWPVLQRSGRKLEPGDSSEDIKRLRQLLWMVGDLAQDDVQGYVYDAVLGRAVIRFQQRHGLRGDGIIGKRTRAALEYLTQ